MRKQPASAEPGIAVGSTLASLVQKVRQLARPSLHRAEDVHALRVAIRRLRTGLWALRDALGQRSRHKLDASLQRLMRRLGQVREWDVLRSHLTAAVPGAGPASLPEGLDTALRHRRRRALRQLRRRLSGAKTARLRDRLDELCVELQRADALVDTHRARAALHARERRVRALLPAAQAGEAQAAHRLRLQIKKLRYTAELFGPLLDAGARRPLLRRLEQAQDRLGAAQDARVEQQQIAQLERREREAAQALLGPAHRQAVLAERRYLGRGLPALAGLAARSSPRRPTPRRA